MKKKRVIFAIIISAVFLACLWVLARPKALGNMSNVFHEPATNTSTVSFYSEANNKIKFSFQSNVDAGELDIVLYDSDGNVAYELDKARALETYYTLDKTDMYTLTAEYSDFIGNYKIAVYEVE